MASGRARGTGHVAVPFEADAPDFPEADLAPVSWAAQLRSQIASALDTVMMGGMGLVFERALLPPLDEFPTLRESVRPYLTPALQHDPDQFFAFGRMPPLAPAATARRPIPDGEIVTWRFASDYVPYHPVDGGDAGACRENETGWLEHWVHDDARPRATMLALHGLTMGRPALDAQALMVDRWFHLGLDVALLTLPFHGARASACCGYSGERFTSWHVGRLNEAVRQSIFDALRVSRWLGETAGGPVGVLGVSLGGYLAALLAALCPDLAFVIPVVPAVCLADLPTRLFAASRYGRAGLGTPVPQATLRRAYVVHSPLHRPLRVPRSRVLIVGGRGDAITPVSHAWALWRHWGQPAAIWFPGGHVACFDRTQVMAGIEAHLRAVGVTEYEFAADELEPFDAPASAPGGAPCIVTPDELDLMEPMGRA